ncbi:MAG: flavodoxin II, partial [Porticoccaceae bacterium]
MTVQIGLFYGSTTCYTEMAGEKIRDEINSKFGANTVILHDIALDPVQRMTEYQYLILGIPTWDFGELQEDWETHWDEIDNLDLTGIQVAVYG